VAANIEVEPYWPGLFAKALETANIKDLITNIGSAVGVVYQQVVQQLPPQ